MDLLSPNKWRLWFFVMVLVVGLVLLPCSSAKIGRRIAKSKNGVESRAAGPQKGSWDDSCDAATPCDDDLVCTATKCACKPDHEAPEMNHAATATLLFDLCFVQDGKKCDAAVLTGLEYLADQTTLQNVIDGLCEFTEETELSLAKQYIAAKPIWAGKNGKDISCLSGTCGATGNCAAGFSQALQVPATPGTDPCPKDKMTAKDPNKSKSKQVGSSAGCKKFILILVVFSFGLLVGLQRRSLQ